MPESLDPETNDEMEDVGDIDGLDEAASSAIFTGHMSDAEDVERLLEDERDLEAAIIYQVQIELAPQRRVVEEVHSPMARRELIVAEIPVPIMAQQSWLYTPDLLYNLLTS